MSCSLAVKRGSGKERTSWFKLQLYGRLARAAVARVGRGSNVVVHGRLVAEEWVSKSTGEKRSGVRVRAPRVLALHSVPHVRAPAHAGVAPRRAPALPRALARWS